MASGTHDSGSGFPVQLNLQGRRCVVVGGGRVATRKVARLVDAGALVEVVAPTLTAALAAQVAAGDVGHVARAYSRSDLLGALLVIAATDDAHVNQRVADDAGMVGAMVNVVDRPDLSTFTVPATVRRGDVSISVSTGGASPVLAQHVRDIVADAVDPWWGSAAELLRSMRRDLKDRFPDSDQRALAMAALLRSSLLEPSASGISHEAVMRGLDHPHLLGHVALVGAGPGDPGLLTVRGRDLLRRADVVVHDRLGTERLLSLPRRNCELIDVGKAPGHHAMTQQDINALLVRLAATGQRIVRLKGGDPMVFGRGGEEALALAHAGYRCEIVPGVTSAIGGAGAAGIPVTHRALSQSVTIVSGHEDPATPAAAALWSSLAGVSGTIVAVMAMRHLAAICDLLVAEGRTPDEAACVITWATTDRERRVEGSLATIAAKCVQEQVGNPAIVVIGPVVEVARQIAGAVLGATESPLPRP